MIYEASLKGELYVDIPYILHILPETIMIFKNAEYIIDVGFENKYISWKDPTKVEKTNK